MTRVFNYLDFFLSSNSKPLLAKKILPCVAILLFPWVTAKTQNLGICINTAFARLEVKEELLVGASCINTNPLAVNATINS